jgi:hypothetical protein
LSDTDANSANDTSTTKIYVNHKPKAKTATASAVAGGKAIRFSLAPQISDEDGDSLRVKLGKVKYGSAKVAGDIVTFTPPKNWHGKFAITYSVTDGKGGKAASLIVITVKPKPSKNNGFRCFKAGC